MKPTANLIADYLIYRAGTHGDFISNLKLQKLLYYCQAWFLAIHGKTLFDDKMEAWVHGPVVPSVYAKFKGYGYDPIKCPNKKPTLPPKASRLVDEVQDEYGRFSAIDLERMTHEELPWIKARGDLPMHKNSNEPIDIGVLKKYFTDKLVKFQVG